VGNVVKSPPHAIPKKEQKISFSAINQYFCSRFKKTPGEVMKKPFATVKTAFFAAFLFIFTMAFLPGFAQEEPMPEFNNHQTTDQKEFNAGEVIIHHVLDDHIWHLWDGHYGTIFLPVIVYSSERGLDVFSSHHFYDEHHNIVTYSGYKLEHNHIYLADSGKAVLDLSITKNVAMLLINATLLLLVFVAVGKAYKKNAGKAPKGLQSFVEPIIVFVRDEVVKPNITHNHEKYLPYLLTLFFFILFGNILGLLPGAGNLTGNIAVTFTLAFFTFIITNVSGNKSYWSHIFWTPGVPLPIRFVILPVEIIGIFTKPISLTIRLFVAITAGHIVLLALISLAFIFQSITVGVMSSAIVLFISLIELLVAGIQAYVFTLFTALYIGMATEVHDHH
jgi:F-type H+-transporting ATPase subunit a